MNYKFAICDDEIIEIKYLSSLVTKWGKKTDNIAIVSTFEDAKSFLFNYAENKDYDILLLDIEMSGANPKIHTMNGVELAKQIRTENTSVQIVFITGFPDFIAEGYEVSALHYLMKPVKEDKLFEVLNKAVIRLQATPRTILFSKTGG